jgi:hypothetical protein
VPALPRKSALLLAVAAGAVATHYLRRDLTEPPDRSGAGVPLVRERRPLGATSDAHLVDRPGDPDWLRELARWVPEPPRTPLGRLLAIVWASPSSLAGLLVGALSGTRPTVRDGVLLFSGVRGLPGLLLRRGGYAATTLGHVVIARRDPSPALMAHELVHTRQAERLGPFAGPVYWYLLARHGYARHPMERAARRAGRSARPARSAPPAAPGIPVGERPAA